MGDKSRSDGEMREAFRELGDNLSALIRAGWQSEERRQVQREIEKGLEELAATLQRAAEDFAEGETGQQLKKDLESLQERAHAEEWGERARQELLRVLSAINQELDSKRREWSEGEDPDSSEESPT